MKLKVFNSIFFLLICNVVFAQYKLKGKITSSSNTEAIYNCEVKLNDEYVTTTDIGGEFRFDSLPQKKYQITIKSVNYQLASDSIFLKNDTVINFKLQAITKKLKEVIVVDNTDFSRTRMRGIENMGIYEGKKSEVIVVDQLTANLSTNNARQVYARVPGLNIWENDGAGLQLSIGGRGLDPNRTSNFNVRQNGYDISADALGYPESYYTPPTEGVERIQVVRGAASLQFGTQFGGLLNFVMKSPNTSKKLEITARQTLGSFNFYNTFTSFSGTVKKVSYYTFFQYKKGNGWRSNSAFDNYNFYSNVNYQLSDKSSVGIDLTYMNYLAQQPGGLTDRMFIEDPRQSNRNRNWFSVNWNLAAIHFNHKFNEQQEFNLRFFGLYANRFSVGFRPNRVSTIDYGVEQRDLIKGDFTNYGVEARFLNRYNLRSKKAVLLTGLRYYNGFNHSQQGLGSAGSDADFKFVNPEQFINYDYKFPNQNIALFAENIFYLSDKLTITPGIRGEYIDTKANGYYAVITRDIAGNVDPVIRINENRNNVRNFVLAGLGVSFKPVAVLDFYGNLSQNYRSITFSDMRISNPSSLIDPDLQDEKGYSFDAGVRSAGTSFFNYDISLFYLNYNNRIGEIQTTDGNYRIIRLRTNIGKAVIKGIESYGEVDLLRILYPKQEIWSGVLFGNAAVINSEYVESLSPGVTGNKVEFVPNLNLKTGAKLAWKKFKTSLQYTFVDEQFSDATNAVDGGVSSVVGLIPAYNLLDLSLSYEWRRFKIEASINNLTNQNYFTRRATGYPGPGILPSDGRSIYFTLQVKI